MKATVATKAGDNAADEKARKKPLQVQAPAPGFEMQPFQEAARTPMAGVPVAVPRSLWALTMPAHSTNRAQRQANVMGLQDTLGNAAASRLIASYQQSLEAPPERLESVALPPSKAPDAAPPRDRPVSRNVARPDSNPVQRRNPPNASTTAPGAATEGRAIPAASGLSGQSPKIQRLGQDLPYVGSLLSYLNPINQLTRIALPGLSSYQKGLLDGIFGNSLATSLIRLNPNSLVAFGGCFRTTGNIINIPGTTIGDTDLIHEATHVWQSQNAIFGVAYAVSALKSMAIAEVIGGDWQKAYDYSNVEKHGIPWRYWNAEQQAHWIEDKRRLPSGWMIDGLLPTFGIESNGV